MIGGSRAAKDERTGPTHGAAPIAVLRTDVPGSGRERARSPTARSSARDRIRLHPPEAGSCLHRRARLRRIVRLPGSPGRRSGPRARPRPDRGSSGNRLPNLPQRGGKPGRRLDRLSARGRTIDFPASRPHPKNEEQQATPDDPPGGWPSARARPGPDREPPRNRSLPAQLGPTAFRIMTVTLSSAMASQAAALAHQSFCSLELARAPALSREASTVSTSASSRSTAKATSRSTTSTSRTSAASPRPRSRGRTSSARSPSAPTTRCSAACSRRASPPTT